MTAEEKLLKIREILELEDSGHDMEMFCVGEEVFDVNAPGTRGVVTKCKDDVLYVMFGDGSCGEEEDVYTFRKTGRIFDLQSILQEL